MSLTISEFAASGEVGVETVRYYQRQGLLREPRKAAGIRKYDEGDVARLRFIRLAQRAGFALAEIRELLELDAGNDRARALKLAEAKIASIDEQIATLQRVRDSLTALAKACRRRTSGICPILRSFEVRG